MSIPPTPTGGFMSHAVSKTEHPITAVFLHWLHLASFLMLTITGMQLRLLDGASPEHVAARTLHDAFVPMFLISAVLRFAWSFLGNGSATRGSNVRQGDWRHFVFRRGDARAAWAWIRKYLGASVEVPEDQKYNPLQKTVYTALFPACIVILALTGLALHPSFAASLSWVTDLLAGEGGVRTAHFVAMWALVALTALHLYAAVLDGCGRITLMLAFWIPERCRAAE